MREEVVTRQADGSPELVRIIVTGGDRPSWLDEDPRVEGNREVLFAQGEGTVICHDEFAKFAKLDPALRWELIFGQHGAAKGRMPKGRRVEPEE